MLPIATMTLVPAYQRLYFVHFEDKVCTLLLPFPALLFYDTIRRQSLRLFYPFGTLSGRD